MRNPGQGSKTRSAYMAVRVSHINETIARQIDSAKNPLKFRPLSVANMAAIFKGAETPRRLLGVEIVEDRCPLTNAIIVPGRTILATCQDISFNGADFATGLARPVFG